MTKPQNILSKTHPKTLLLAIDAPYNPTKNIESYFEEFLNLVKTNQIEYDELITVKLRTIDSVIFLTKGKLEEIRKVCSDLQIEEVIISDRLTALQERNLEDYLNVRVFDRTQLILEIFEKAAHTAEGKTQVEIAMLQHKKTRVAGRGFDLDQQRGFIGMRAGAGETQKEKDLRHIESRIQKLRGDLTAIEKSRETQRKRRLANKVPLICLIGYTNAGKSTLLNLLTKSDVLAEDKLFATLDTTTRELFINSKKMGLLSDTVGFIQQLPHNLIEAFKSTLAELAYADLLIEVVDIADINWQTHIKVVKHILEELEVSKPIVYVFNKFDKLTADEQEEGLKHLELYTPHVVINALSKDGAENLIHYIEEWHLQRQPSLPSE
jgi:GTP-binding protein HflX